MRPDSGMGRARRGLLAVAVALACRGESDAPAAASDSLADTGATPAVLSDSALNAVTRPRFGDFDSMRARHIVRILVVPSMTHYFVDQATPRGLAVDAAAMFESALNRKYRTGAQKIRVALIPVRPDQLIPALLAGRGDIAAAGLTVTPGRRNLVDFSTPVFTNVSEIVVTGPASPPLSRLDDLAGTEIFVRPSSVYYANLQALNADFTRRGLAVIRLRPAPEALADEDLLEMLNAGLVPLVVLDDYLATFWKEVLPGITPRPDLAVASGAEIAWMTRKNSPELLGNINAFLAANPPGSGSRNVLLHRYLRNTKYVTSATSPAAQQRFQGLVALFKKYGARYHLNYLLLMAQGYQESRLDQNVRSQAGAIGIMQIMPATGAALGVGDIHHPDANVHAGAKYVRSLIDRYFSGDSLDDVNRMLFAFAAYNAGPARIAGLRRDAAARGLDPNRWQGNVDQIAAEKIGQETVTYISNIYKYYVGYTLLMEHADERAAALQAR